MHYKKGFSLLELILVLGIAAAVSFMKFQDLKKDQENMVADAVGQQIKQVGSAVNGYINIHYDKLSTLTSVSTSTGSDPGPRTCSTANNTCTITYQTLVNDGLLPSSFNGINANKSSYTIVLKRQGTSPNFIINGLVTTNNAWTEGSSIRYDLLGKAMQAAGIDSGMAKTTSTVSGYSGSWAEQSSDYSNINKTGILGYRVGYDSAMYSVFLRRDGTLPMTGDLNMGGQDINNAQNITASGTGTFGGEVVAHNGNGDAITLGGDASGGAAADYELRLGSNKTLTIFSPNSTQYSTVLNVNRNTLINERLGVKGYDPNDVPSTWGGGLRTLDVLASGTLAVVKSGKTGSTGDWAAYMTNSGNIYASTNITSANTINATGRIQGGDLYSNSETYTTNWFRTLGDGGIYFQKYGGGWNMGDTSTINAYNGKNVQTSGGFYGGYIRSTGNIDASGNISGNGIYGNYVHSNGQIDAAGQIISGGRLTTNEFLQINGVAGEGGGCSPNGAVGRTSAGKVISCTNGTWQGASADPVIRTATASAYRFPAATAYCDAGMIATGGGAQCNAGTGYIWLTASRPEGSNGWRAACDSTEQQTGTITVWVKCI